MLVVVRDQQLPAVLGVGQSRDVDAVGFTELTWTEGVHRRVRYDVATHGSWLHSSGVVDSRVFVGTTDREVMRVPGICGYRVQSDSAAGVMSPASVCEGRGV